CEFGRLPLQPLGETIRPGDLSSHWKLFPGIRRILCTSAWMRHGTFGRQRPRCTNPDVALDGNRQFQLRFFTAAAMYRTV
ncbi:MAG: hypothetical protein OXI33_14485, partial [Chloroflexota bacterium]|nr:hypothetical protein [Chloroflexota bacterium]